LKVFTAILPAFAILLFFSCNKDPAIKEELPSDDIHLIVPQGWTYPVSNFQNNPFTKDGFILGRKLFYETQLSSDNSISCGSCHQQLSGFSHPDKKISQGVNGATGSRNTPSLVNLNWHTNFMWDGKLTNMETQPVSPITNPLEMNEDIDNVLIKLSRNLEYRRLFKNAFGSENISEDLLLKALAQFTGMLVSYNSKYDKYSRGEISLSTDEMNGFILFQQKCNACHSAPLFTNFQFENNGLDTTFADGGRGNITGLTSDSGKFKVPSLRNVSLSKPYMHDGRFVSLEDVLDHYSDGIMNSSTLNPMLTGGMSLTDQEKQNIIAFLNTLSDDSFIHDKRFKDPFNN